MVIAMRNDEARITNYETMTKQEARMTQQRMTAIHHSIFGFPSTLDIRHSAF
jgi:hypothetical protein